MPRSRPKPSSESITAATDKADAKKIALALLSRREQSPHELGDKLRRKGFDDDLIEPLLAELSEAGWLSVRRYCESMLRQRMQQGYGPVRLGWEFAQHRIDRELSTEVLAAVDDAEWLLVATTALRKRFGDATDADVTRQMNFLKRRGFFSAQISQVMKARRAGGVDDDA